MPLEKPLGWGMIVAALFILKIIIEVTSIPRRWKAFTSLQLFENISARGP